MFGILINVSVVNYYMIIAAVVLGVIFFKIRGWYILTAKDLKHLEGISMILGYIFFKILNN